LFLESPVIFFPLCLFSSPGSTKYRASQQLGRTDKAPPYHCQPRAPIRTPRPTGRKRETNQDRGVQSVGDLRSD
jgi:hypothetical protein